MTTDALLAMDEGKGSKRRVFISASSEDSDWIRRIRNASGSETREPRIEWIGGSTIPAGSNWQDEVSSAIQRAEAVLVLVSSAYLASTSAAFELNRWKELSNSGGPALFLLVLEECEWSRHPLLSKIQVPLGVKPLSKMHEGELQLELQDIVTKLSEWASQSDRSSGHSDSSNELTLPFSPSASAVLAKASELAKSSKRGAVTSSCLLFALADDAGSLQKLAWFVRKEMDREGKYNEARKKFMGTSSSAKAAGTVRGLKGQFSRNALAILECAQTIASKFKESPQQIHARHLFAAMLVADGEPNARRRLEGLNIDLGEIARDFFEFISQEDGPEGIETWRKILGQKADSLPTQELEVISVNVADDLILRDAVDFQHVSSSTVPSSPFASGTPGYTSEFCGVGGLGPVPDHLGVESLAHRLAELMVLRETRLPLAVGLFGNWGSGKSHFMNLMDRHMKALSTQAKTGSKTSGNPDAQWCCEVVPIYFNAWHYSDSSLWASLVTQVFDALFSHLQPKEDELKLLQSQLREAGGVTALAAEEAKEASEALLQAKQALTSAKEEEESARAAVKSLKEGLTRAFLDLNTEKNRARLGEILGIQVNDKTIPELIDLRAEFKSFAGQTKALWRRTFAPEGRLKRFAWMTGALVVMAVSHLAAQYSSQVQALLVWIGPKVQALLSVIGAMVGFWISVFRPLQQGLSEVEKFQKQAEDAIAEMPKDPKVKLADEKLLQAEGNEVKAKLALAAAQSEESRLTNLADNLRPERRLSRFIEARARSADYRGQLGLVSLARRDFEELNGIFADAESLKCRIKDHPEAANDLKKLSASVDRVVLFIDDLDRCEPEKVVDVLQAVHLLLAYPLFGVVVGVDQRCLKQSLRIRFSGLLTPDLNNNSVQGARKVFGDESPATPLDYLEKIFHIPLHLPPMGLVGFETLVEKLSEPVTNLSLDIDKATEDHVEAKAAAASSDQFDPMLEESNKTEAKNAGFQVDTSAESSVDASGKLRQIPVRVVGSLPLHRWERDALKKYHSLIPTPRGATRLLNTYRLVRAGIPSHEWDLFRGDSGGGNQFLLAMLLLAVAAGQPAVARGWFTLLRKHETGPLLDMDEAPEARGPGWDSFKTLHDSASLELNGSLTAAVRNKWLDQIERFTF